MSENPRRFMRHPVSVEFRAHEANQAQHGDILFDVLNMSQGGAFLEAMSCWISAPPWRLYSRSIFSRCSDRKGRLGYTR